MRFCHGCHHHHSLQDGRAQGGQAAEQSRAEQSRAEQAAGRGGGGCVGEGPSCDTRPYRFPFKLHLSVLVTHHDDAGCEAEVGIILPAAASGAVESRGANVGLAAGGQWQQRGGRGRPNAFGNRSRQHPMPDSPAGRTLQTAASTGCPATSTRQVCRPHCCSWLRGVISRPQEWGPPQDDRVGLQVAATVPMAPSCLLTCCVRCPGVSVFQLAGLGVSLPTLLSLDNAAPPMRPPGAALPPLAALLTCVLLLAGSSQASVILQVCLGGRAT